MTVRPVHVLGGLVLGLLCGILVLLFPAPALLWLVAAVEPVGGLWVNAIRMTVVPLVISLLVTAAAAADDTRVMRRLGARTLMAFGGLLVLSALVGVALVPWLFAWLHVDPGTAAAMRGTSATAVAAAKTALPTLGQWVTDVVPANPIKAAADGAMLPLVVAALCFGLALQRIAPERRLAVVTFFRGVADAMIVIVEAVIALAPVGVFALMLPVASRTGAAAAGALGYYVVAVAVGCGLLTAGLYVTARLVGGVPLARFARAALGPQAVAMSSTSSLASLPALVEAADRDLGLPPDVTGVVLPLAVSSFKVTAPLIWVVAGLFLSRLYGVPLHWPQLLTIVATSMVASVSSPGVPHGWLLVISPLMASLGVPAEGVGLLIAVDAIPDMFVTTANVTADLVAVAIVARHSSA